MLLDDPFCFSDQPQLPLFPLPPWLIQNIGPLSILVKQLMPLALCI